MKGIMEPGPVRGASRYNHLVSTAPATSVSRSNPVDVPGARGARSSTLAEAASGVTRPDEAVGEVELDGPHALGLADLAGEREDAALTRVPAVVLAVGQVEILPVLVRGRDEVYESVDRHLGHRRGRRGRGWRRLGQYGRGQDAEDGDHGEQENNASPHHCLLNVVDEMLETPQSRSKTNTCTHFRSDPFYNSLREMVKEKIGRSMGTNQEKRRFLLFLGLAALTESLELAPRRTAEVRLRSKVAGPAKRDLRFLFPMLGQQHQSEVGNSPPPSGNRGRGANRSASSASRYCLRW